MRFQQALQFLDSHQNFEKKSFSCYAKELNLARVRKVLSHLDHPEKKFPSVVIAGTNGKGSTAYLLAEALRASGFKTGLYTSPHLETICERIQINGSFIPKNDFAAEMTFLAEQLPPPLQKEMTYFEILTVLAFSYFSRQKIDFAVLEVGMGGRLDAVNIVTPEISLLTSIHFDHEKNLGNTLAQIAAEKAGILKEKGLSLSEKQLPGVQKVLSKAAKAKKNKLHFVAAQALPFPLQMPGEHQKKNAALVWQALKALKQKKGFTISLSKSEKAMRRLQVPARLERVSHDPLVFLDGAHNPQAMESSLTTLRKLYPKRRLVLLAGFSKDKNIAKIIDVFLKTKPRLWITCSQSIRALDPQEFKKMLPEPISCLGYFTKAVPAFKKVLKTLRRDDLLLVTGSFYLAGEISNYLKDSGLFSRKKKHG